MSEGFVRYQWQGIDITLDEFLDKTDSKMVKAIRVMVRRNLITHKITKTMEPCEVPEIFIRSQRFGPDCFGNYDYYKVAE